MPDSSSSAGARRTRRSTACSTSSACSASPTPRRSPSSAAIRRRPGRRRALGDAALPRGPARLGLAHAAGAVRPDPVPDLPRAACPRSSSGTTPRSRSSEYLEGQRLPRRSSTGSSLRCCSRSGASSRRSSAGSPRTTRCTTWERTRRGDSRLAAAEPDPRRARGLRRCARARPARDASFTSARRCDGSTRAGDGYAVEDARGIRHLFDQVIVATNARQALRPSRGGSRTRAVAPAAEPFRVLRHHDRDPRRSPADAAERGGLVGRQRAVGRGAQRADRSGILRGDCRSSRAG